MEWGGLTEDIRFGGCLWQTRVDSITDDNILI